MAEGFRVSPPRVFPVATRAARPPAAPPGPADAHRQTGFVLGPEADHVLALLNAEGRIAEVSSAASYRKQPLASSMLLWSRSWLARLQALHAVEWGNYAAAMPLIRSAADYHASMLYALGAGQAEWESWLAQGGLALRPSERATEFRLHAFRAAEVLAAEPELGEVYRSATDLAMPHFGASLLLAGSESGPGKVAVTFGDRDFQLGLAEISLGWLLQLGALMVEHLAARPQTFAPDPAGAALDGAATARAFVERPDRCRITPTEV
ncbi:MAG: hypothetical protein WEC33_05615, partial [Dehalococcoidia bacterium]